MTNLLLATSNGTGMGHLTRQAAVGLALGESHRPSLFSLSIGLPQAMSLGMNGEYAPSYDRPWIASNAWNGYLRDRLAAIIHETSCEIVLFDGVAAYPGIGKTSATERETAFVWIRRGMWRRGTNPKQLRRAGYFDMVIEPGDLAGDADVGPTRQIEDVTRVAPISLVEVLGMLPREEARQRLGLPTDGEIALVTLGSGRLGDVAGPGGIAIQTILDDSNLHIAVTRSAVAMNDVAVTRPDRVTVIRDVYPLVRYLSAFDLAVSSAGYNAVHELVPAGLPTLFVANTSTRTDDQETRAARLAELGLGLHSPDNEPATVHREVTRLLDPYRRADLAAAASASRSGVTGASETARIVCDFADTFTRRRPAISVVVSEQVQRVKETIKEALGEERTNRLKRALGRQPSQIMHRTEVRLVDAATEPVPGSPTPLLVTDQLDSQMLRAEIPVEHILRGSSDAYRDRRLEMIKMYYDVAG